VLTEYDVKFVCPRCKKQAELLVIDTMDVFSTLYKVLVTKPQGYADLMYDVGYAFGKKHEPDPETLTRKHIECSECGYQFGHEFCGESDDTSVYEWLEENGCLVETSSRQEV